METQNKAASIGFSQFLSFTLGHDDFGIDILRVQEIRGWEGVRVIPDTPKYIKGVINLRNTVVPIVDLRIRFGQTDVAYTPTTVIIILSVEQDNKQRVVGVVVDAVSDVFDIRNDDIKEAPDLGVSVDTRYISGMVMVDKRMVILLDADKLLKSNELMALDKIAS